MTHHLISLMIPVCTDGICISQTSYQYTLRDLNTHFIYFAGSSGGVKLEPFVVDTTTPSKVVRNSLHMEKTSSLNKYTLKS